MTDDDVYRLYATTFAKLKSNGMLRDADFGLPPDAQVRDIRGIVALAMAAEDVASGTLQAKSELIPRINELTGKAAPDYYNG